MTVAWPRVRLGEVLRRSKETTEILPDVEYREVTVRLWGKGVVERGRLAGAEISGNRRAVARVEQFIASRIDARNGAMGIVPPALDGAVVTNDFPLFAIDSHRLLPAYLGWLCRTSGFVELCLRTSEGTTNRVRLKEERFLALEIPLPPLAEQRRIVARIDELAAHIHKARTFRHQAREGSERLMAAEENNIWPSVSLNLARPLGELTIALSRGKQSEQGESDHHLIKTQHVQQDRCITTNIRLAAHIAAKVRPEAILQDGDILVACSAAGCLGRVARFRDDGRTTSTDTHVAVVRPDPEVINPDYLYAFLRGSQGQFQLRSRERGDWQREKVGFRLTELNVNDLRAVPVPVVPISEQIRIVAELDALQAEVDALKRRQAESVAELDALLPSILNCAFSGAL